MRRRATIVLYYCHLLVENGPSVHANLQPSQPLSPYLLMLDTINCHVDGESHTLSLSPSFFRATFRFPLSPSFNASPCAMETPLF